MKAITTNIWHFPDVIQGGYVYVDKTDLLLKMIQDGPRGSFFISRPRRFGKSLMLSTLKCIFEGRKELFEGLKISETDYDWKVYPVLMLDMTAVRAETSDEILRLLSNLVLSVAKDIGINLEHHPSPTVLFESLWQSIKERDIQVVVLVDEYDIPLQGFLNKPEEYERVRQLMHDFYIRLKSHADNIRFLMLTGVTKIAKLSIFSGLNSPTDLSFDEQYAALLGYTHEELENCFSEHINAFAVKRNLTSDEVYNGLLEWYDHYRFSAESEVCVLNPVSLGYALTTRTFKNFWIQTGHSSLVIETLVRNGDIPTDFENFIAKESDLNFYDIDGTMSSEALFYQGGYLTIKDVLPTGVLKLGAPNREVKEYLVSGFLQKKIAKKEVYVYDKQIMASMALAGGRLDEAIACFRAAVAACPYSWLVGDEGGAKVLFLCFFYSMPHTRLATEEQMASGVIDAVVETKENVYIFEFKFDKSAQEALDQIIEKGYARPYLGIGKKVYGIGLNFNPNESVRGIDEAVVKVIK